MKLPSDFFSINGDPFTEEEISELKRTVDSSRECLMVCVWVPNLHKEISQNDYCDKTRSGR